MGKIQNVVFDMGNVLLDFQPDFSLNKYCADEEEKTLIRRELFEGPEWEQGDLGLIRDEYRFELIKDRVPREHWQALSDCAYKWHECMVPLPGAEAFCDHLKGQGYRLYLLSNASTAFYDYYRRFRPFGYFDGLVVSADIHLLKPNVKIYQYLLEKYDLAAGECLFIDDRPDNVEGARAAGLQAVQFRGSYDQIRAQFQL